jgi:hypothetical protein
MVREGYVDRLLRRQETTIAHVGQAA